MHQLREREDNYEQEAKENVNLMRQGCVSNVVGGPREEREQTLRPSVEIHVMVEVAVDCLHCAHQSGDYLEEDDYDEEISAEVTVSHNITVCEPSEG